MSDREGSDGLERFADNVWLLDGDRVHMFAIPFQTRSVIIRLTDGSLWVHSPVGLTARRMAAVQALGPVAHLVAPNKLHSLALADWAKAFGDARVWVSPEFGQRHPVQPGWTPLGPERQEGWPEEIEAIPFAGHRVLDDTVFLHRLSRTLIITDILQNHDPDGDNWFWRNVKRLAGVGGPEGGVPLDFRMTVRDRHLMRAAAETILGWDFDRITLSHGACVTGDAKAYFRRHMSWLLH